MQPGSNHVEGILNFGAALGLNALHCPPTPNPPNLIYAQAVSGRLFYSGADQEIFKKGPFCQILY